MSKLYNEKTFRKGTLKLIYRTFKSVKWSLMLGVLLSLGTTALTLVTPLFLQKLIDKEIDAKVGIKDAKSFFTTAAIYLLMILLRNTLSFFKQYQLKRTSNKASHFLRRDLYDHALNLPLSFFDRTPVGKISGRIVGDVEEIKNMFFLGFDGMFSAISFILASIIYVLTIDYRAALILTLPIPILILLIYVYNKFSAKYNIEYRKGESKIVADLNEHLHGSDLIRAYGVSDGVNEEFSKLNQKQFKIGTKIETFDSFFSFNISDLLSNISTLLILIIAGYSFLNGTNTISIGFMIVLLNYNGNIYDMIQGVLRRINVIEKALASSHHLVEFMEEEHEFDGDFEIADIKGDVELKDVSFSYIKDNPVLHNIDISAPHGSKTAIVGDTGSGKSSIINLIFRFYNPDSGVISIDDTDISKLSKESFRKKMALVLQDPFIFNDTLRNNVTLGENFTDDEIINAMNLAGGEMILKRLRKGLDTHLNGEGVGLSLGEKQIVTFARTIIRDPKILVLDEATASIDTETEKHIEEGLNHLMEGRTSFIIAHRLSTIRNCDNIIVLEKGRIIEAGTHDELMDKKGKYFSLATKEEETEKEPEN